MTKWEYMVIFPVTEGHVTKVKWVNEREIPDWKHGPATIEYLNGLGEQGWELVAASGMGSVYPSGLWLKRLVS